MSFVVSLEEKSRTAEVMNAIIEGIASSRFTAGVRHGKRDGQIEIGWKECGVRLRNKKGYCGNHAGPCRLGGGRHAKARYLEGSDWIGWNDMINDILDRLYISANVKNSLLIIRKGRKRRLEYWSVDNGGEWNKDELDECYDDYCGQEPPITEFPEGTPGIASYRLDAETPELMAS